MSQVDINSPEKINRNESDIHESQIEYLESANTKLKCYYFSKFLRSNGLLDIICCWINHSPPQKKKKRQIRSSYIAKTVGSKVPSKDKQ